MYANKQWKCTPQFAYKTVVKINSFQVNQNDISLAIKTLDAEKAYDWDNISIKMIQICGDPIALPVMLLFNDIEREKVSNPVFFQAIRV